MKSQQKIIKREIQFEPITQRLDEVEKAVKQTDEDLSKKLDLVPINKKFESSPPQLTFTSEDDEELSKVQLLVDKGLEVTSKGVGALARRCIHFPDKIFGTWLDDDGIYIGNKNNKVMIDGNDMIINNEKYKGTHGLWKLLTQPNKEKLDKET